MNVERLRALLNRRVFLQRALSLPFLPLLAERVGFAEEPKPGIVEPTADEAKAAIEAMFATNATNVTPERLAACATIQRSVDRLRAAEFASYFSADAQAAREFEEERAVLRFLNASFDKAIREIRETQVQEGTVVFWHIYNMGYVVKTPTQTFAIDVKHRRADELVPLIDFLLITHKHGDHYVQPFCEAVADAGKPVVTNFLDDEWTTPAEGRDYVFGDCSVKARLVDHNATLLKFVTTYEIDCGPKSGNVVVFHVGDACSVNQIKADEQVDVFIPHLAVGLDVPKAVNETLKPKTMLLSHILELGHLIDQWRWSYEHGYNVVKKCANDSVILPMWGEKITYSR